MDYNPFRRIKNRNFSLREDLIETGRDIKNYKSVYSLYGIGIALILVGYAATNELPVKEQGFDGIAGSIFWLLGGTCGFGGGIFSFIQGNERKKCIKERLEQSVS